MMDSPASLSGGTLFLRQAPLVLEHQSPAWKLCGAVPRPARPCSLNLAYTITLPAPTATASSQQRQQHQDQKQQQQQHHPLRDALDGLSESDKEEDGIDVLEVENMSVHLLQRSRPSPLSPERWGGQSPLGLAVRKNRQRRDRSTPRWVNPFIPEEERDEDEDEEEEDDSEGDNLHKYHEDFSFQLHGYAHHRARSEEEPQVCPLEPCTTTESAEAGTRRSRWSQERGVSRELERLAQQAAAVVRRSRPQSDSNSSGCGRTPTLMDCGDAEWSNQHDGNTTGLFKSPTPEAYEWDEQEGLNRGLHKVTTLPMLRNNICPPVITTTLLSEPPQASEGGVPVPVPDDIASTCGAPLDIASGASSCNSSDGILVTFSSIYDRSHSAATPETPATPDLASPAPLPFDLPSPIAPSHGTSSLSQDGSNDDDDATPCWTPRGTDSNCNYPLDCEDDGDGDGDGDDDGEGEGDGDDVQLPFVPSPLVPSPLASELAAAILQTHTLSHARLSAPSQSYYKLVTCDLSSQSSTPSPAWSSVTSASEGHASPTPPCLPAAEYFLFSRDEGEGRAEAFTVEEHEEGQVARQDRTGKGSSDDPFKPDVKRSEVKSLNRSCDATSGHPLPSPGQRTPVPRVPSCPSHLASDAPLVSDGATIRPQHVTSFVEMAHSRRGSRGPSSLRTSPEDAQQLPSGDLQSPPGRHESPPGDHQLSPGHHDLPRVDSGPMGLSPANDTGHKKECGASSTGTDMATLSTYDSERLVNWDPDSQPSTSKSQGACQPSPGSERFSKDQRPTSLPIQPFVLHLSPGQPAQQKPLGSLLNQYLSQGKPGGAPPKARAKDKGKGKGKAVPSYLRPSPLGGYPSLHLDMASSSDTCSTCTPSPVPLPVPVTVLHSHARRRFTWGGSRRAGNSPPVAPQCFPEQSSSGSSNPFRSYVSHSQSSAEEALDCPKIFTREEALDCPKIFTREEALDYPKIFTREEALDYPKIFRQESSCSRVTGDRYTSPTHHTVFVKDCTSPKHHSLLSKDFSFSTHHTVFVKDRTSPTLNTSAGLSLGVSASESRSPMPVPRLSSRHPLEPPPSPLTKPLDPFQSLSLSSCGSDRAQTFEVGVGAGATPVWDGVHRGRSPAVTSVTCLNTPPCVNSSPCLASGVADGRWAQCRTSSALSAAAICRPAMTNRFQGDHQHHQHQYLQGDRQHQYLQGDSSYLADRPHLHGDSSYLTDRPPEEFSLSPTASTEALSIDLMQKQALLRAVGLAVNSIVSYFEHPHRHPDEKLRLGNSTLSPRIARLVLSQLCPAIRNILQDGLRSHTLDLIVGQRRNQPWDIVLASTQPGPTTRVLHSLVSVVSKCSQLTRHSMRFNAFIMGLLNLRALEFWLNHLYTCVDALSPLYHHSALVPLWHGPCRPHLHELLLLLEPLATLPFDLHLLSEPRLLLLSTRHPSSLLSQPARSSLQMSTLSANRSQQREQAGSRIGGSRHGGGGVRAALLSPQTLMRFLSSSPEPSAADADAEQRHWQTQRQTHTQTQYHSQPSGGSSASQSVVGWWLRQPSVVEAAMAPPVVAQENRWMEESRRRRRGEMEERDERGMGRMECVTQEEEYEEEEEEEQSPRALRWARLFGARVGAPTRPESEQQALSRPQKNRLPSHWLSLDRSALEHLAQSVWSGRRQDAHPYNSLASGGRH